MLNDRFFPLYIGLPASQGVVHLQTETRALPASLPLPDGAARLRPTLPISDISDGVIINEQM